MTDRWTEFLEDQGLTLGADGHTHLDAENIDMFQKLTGDTICDLSNEALVRVDGDEAQAFLQNQLTNDLASIDQEQSMLAGYCNPKGRLICIFRLWRDGDGFILQLPADIQETSVERLRKYILRAKVKLSNDPTMASFGVCGKTAAKGLEQLVGTLPHRDNALIRSSDIFVVRVSGNGRPRFQVVGPVESCIETWGKLKWHATVMGSWTWARLDIIAGLPNITTNTSEAFVPQMVNLDLLSGVSFRKGCYPGQEIVARMHYLGNLKQRMARFRIDDDRRPLPGDRVYTKGNASPAGTVVDAQPGTGGDWDLLAVVRIADLTREALCLKNENGPVLFQQDLPYSVIDTDKSDVVKH